MSHVDEKIERTTGCQKKSQLPRHQGKVEKKRTEICRVRLLSLNIGPTSQHAREKISVSIQGTSYNNNERK